MGDPVGTTVELGAKLLLGTGLGRPLALGASVRTNDGSFVALGAKLWLGRAVGVWLGEVEGVPLA